MEHPVFSGHGDLLGSVSVLFKPKEVLAAAWGKAKTQPALKPWAMDAAGCIIHNQYKS